MVNIRSSCSSQTTLTKKDAVTIKLPQYITKLLKKMRKLAIPYNGTVFMTPTSGKNIPLIKVIIDGQSETIGGIINNSITMTFQNGECIKLER